MTEREKVRAIIEAARTLVRSADEFPPEDVGVNETWYAAESLERLFIAIDAYERVDSQVANEWRTRNAAEQDDGGGKDGA